jgi:siroheme synthase
MAVSRVGPVAEALIRFGRPPGTPVTVIADGTMPTQRIMDATLETVAQRVADEGIQPPAVVVIGAVVAVAAELAELARDLGSASIAGVTPGDSANRHELTQAGRWKEGA